MSAMDECRQNLAGAVLGIDLGAIRDNWRSLQARLAGAECAAVVKADAYGLGALKVGPALYAAGCRSFFVAHLDEAIALRPLLGDDAAVYVLHGAHPGAEPEFLAHGVVPVLNSRPQVDAWRSLAARRGQRLAAILQVDTGMARLGLSATEFDQLAEDESALSGITLNCVMSHLACAEDRAHPANPVQRERFLAARARLPGVPASLANSSGIFLGADYHFDLARPGAALYGVAPTLGEANPLQQVIHLQGRVIQTRTVAAGTGVGYSHTWKASRRSRIATVAVGYADGYLRALSNRGHAFFDGVQIPLVGKVSMDTITVDITDLPETALVEGSLIDLADLHHGVDAIAARAGTIGYEILTSLGQRYARRYFDSGRG